MKKQYKTLKLNNKEMKVLKKILAEKIFNYNIKINELEEEIQNKEANINELLEIQNKYVVFKNIFNIINYLER